MKHLLYCFSISWAASPFYTFTRLLCKLTTPLLTFLDSYLLKLLLDSLDSAQDVQTPLLLLSGIVALSLVIKVLTSTMNGMYTYTSDMQCNVLNHFLQKRVMDKGLDSDVSLFDDTQKFNHFSTVQRDIQAFINYFWLAMEAASAAVSCGISFIVLSQENFLFGVVILISTAPSVLVQKYFTKKYYKISCDLIQDVREADYTFQIATTRDFGQMIRVLNIGPWLKDKFDGLWRKTFQRQKSAYKQCSIAQLVMQIVPQIIVAVIELFIVLRVFNGEIGIGSLTLYTTMLSQLVTNTNLLVANIVSVYDNRIKIDNIQAYDAIQPSVTDDGKNELDKIETIRFSHVSFSYPNTNENALSDISLEIHANEFVALVGENGSGKTTIVKLLLRLYDVSEGEILINGKNIKEYTLESLRRQCSTYFQNQNNFSYTIRENVGFGNISDTETAHITDAIQKGDASKILEKSPYGIDTYLSKDFSEKGLVLSGGESQKIALSQTIFGASNASLVILDEPSSALDALSEQRVLQNLQEMKPPNSRITILISHQLSNVQQASCIYVLSKGRLLESGTHSDLIKEASLYYKMYSKQAGRYQSLGGPESENVAR